MKKEVLLVLGILEGRGLHPVEGHKIQIEALLDNHKLSTGTFPLTNAPKFNTEISWEAEKQTIRRYKINRIPIKIQCYELGLDKIKNRKLLGYIILPLSSAIEGVEGDPRWYKLLGSADSSGKTPPGILLRLHLEAMTLDQQNQNGQHVMEDSKISYLLEKNNFVQGPEGLEIRHIQTNGSTKVTQYESKQSDLPVVTNIHTIKPINNGTCVQDEEILEEDEFDNMEDEEMLEYESEEDYSDDDPVGAIANDEFSSAKDSDAGQLIELSGGENGQQEDIGSLEKMAKAKEKPAEIVQKESLLKEDISETLAAETSNKKPFEKETDHELLMKARASTREHLRTLAESIRVSNMQKKSSSASFSKSASINEYLEKRALDTSSIFDEVNSKTKSRKCDSSSDQVKTETCQAGNEINKADSKDEFDNASSLLRSSLANMKDSTSTAIILSQSIKESHEFAESSHTKSSQPQKLVPYLNQEEGYFTIGPSEEGVEEFMFSVTIIYAKNLSKVIPLDASPMLKDGFQFCYSLLGYSIYTDTFHELDSPRFLAEKASTVIRSSHENLSCYFAQHYFLPIHFLSGDTCLGVCSIDILQLMEIGTKNESKVEGVFEVISAGEVSANSENLESKAVIGASFEVSKICGRKVTGSSSRVFPSEGLSSFLPGKRLRGSYNEVIVSDSMSSSDSDTSSVCRKKMETRKIKCRSSCKRRFTKHQELTKCLFLERQKMELLHEAAYEVERWKDEQKRLFMKEWTEKEETLQRLIASEWSSKVKIIEGELSHRLSECDKLQEKLDNALAKLGKREEKIKNREDQMIHREQELMQEKEKLQTSSRPSGNKEREDSISSHSYIKKQLENERKKRNFLEKEVFGLREELLLSEETMKAQNKEIISLRRKLIQSDDIISVTKDKEALEKKVESLQERKQYYKCQWLNALTDLHKLHSSHKEAIKEMTADQEPYHSRHETWGRDGRSSPPPDSLSVGFKLRKLKDERKVLLESGLYPSDHSVIKTIEKKIKQLVG